MLVVATLLGAALPASAQPWPPAVASEVVYADAYPSPGVRFPNGARSIPAVPFWVPAGYRPLLLDLYLPPDTVPRPETGFPLIVYVHGGGWMVGDTRRNGAFTDWPGVLARIAQRGYVVASVDYRRSGEAKFPAQAQDVKAAIRWLRSNARPYGIDPLRAVVWGESSGAHLAALATLGCESPFLAPTESVHVTGSPEIVNVAVSECVQGGVGWFGVYDGATIAAHARGTDVRSRDEPDAPEWLLLGCFAGQCSPDLIAAASPVTYVDPGDPPMLLIVGDRDLVVPPRQSLEMAATLDSAGVLNELVVIPRVGHGFIGNDPATTRTANLRALEATLEFIDRTIGVRPTPHR